MIWKMKMAAKSSFVLLWGKNFIPSRAIFQFQFVMFSPFFKKWNFKTTMTLAKRVKAVIDFSSHFSFFGLPFFLF